MLWSPTLPIGRGGGGGGGAGVGGWSKMSMGGEGPCILYSPIGL